MQLRAIESAAAGKVVSGASERAQYQRIRRAAIRLGVHRGRTRKPRAKTYSLCVSRDSLN